MCYIGEVAKEIHQRHIKVFVPKFTSQKKLLNEEKNLSGRITIIKIKEKI